MVSVERIFVRGTNWVGDAVMSIPALRELRRARPDAHIALAVRPWVRAIYDHADYVDEIIPYDRQNSDGGLHWLAWIERLRLRRFDSALLLQNAFEAALMTRLAAIPRRIGYAGDSRGRLLTDALVRRTTRPRHQIYDYLDLLTLSGLSPRDYATGDFHPDLSIRLPGRIVARARQRLADSGILPGQTVVAISPGAFFGAAKRWFPERYAELGNRLAGEGARIVLVGSSGEVSLAETIAAAMKPSPLVLTGRTTLEELMAVLASCDLLVTNDSGPMHLGCALGIPLLALFGSTDDEATGPYSPRARWIHKHVECSPCLLRECPIDLRCFDRIHVDEVFAECMAILNAGVRG